MENENDFEKINQLPIHSSGNKNLAYVLIALVIIAIAGMLILKPMPKVAETPVEVVPATKLTILEKKDTKVSIENAEVSITITYPEFANVPANINSDIKDFIDNEVSMIKSLVAEGMPDSVAQTYTLDGKYEIEQANTDYVSLVFTINEDTGGAHPNQFFRTFNFDAKTGKSMVLADLYSSDPNYFPALRVKIKAAVHDELVGILLEQGDGTTDPEDLLFEDISTLKESTFEHFTFGTGYIRFYFSPYDIAPYSAGSIVTKVER